jgi:hypothetical protein
MATRVTAEDASLETLAWMARERDARDEEDPEAELEDLIRRFVNQRSEILWDEDGVREDEFECASCHLIAHRSRLARGRRNVCSDCAANALPPRVKVIHAKTAA